MLLRQLAEVILVGAGTARTENYRGARKPSLVTGEPPPIAVITATAAAWIRPPPVHRHGVPPLILTAAASPEANRRRLAEAGAEWWCWTATGLRRTRCSPS